MEKNMDNVFIMGFIIVANLIAILLTYYSFNKSIEKTKRLLYTMISVGVMYILILIVYSFSSIGIAKKASSAAKDMITYTFVPVNTILVLPFMIRSFNKRKENEITTSQLNMRATIVLIITIAILVSEFFYFRKIQQGIIDIYNQKQNMESQNSSQASQNLQNTENQNTSNTYQNIEENMVNVTIDSSTKDNSVNSTERSNTTSNTERGNTVNNSERSNSVTATNETSSTNSVSNNVRVANNTVN
jgi:hypothetical protein